MAEHNLIQKPDLLRGLQQATGVRQAHIVPSLADNVQPVIVIEDTRRFPGSKPYEFAGARHIAGDGAVNGPTIALSNPTGSGVVAHLRGIILACQPSVAAALTMTFQIQIDTNPAGAAPTRTRGARLIYPITGAIPGVDLTNAGRSTACEVQGRQETVITTYLYEAWFPDYGRVELNENNWARQFFLLPGGRILASIRDVTIDLYANFIWEEIEIGSLG